MIGLGLRLAVAGGKEAITRLALIAVAVAIGVGLLLTTLGSINAFSAQDQRYAWLETGYAGAEAPEETASPDEGAVADPLWWRLRADHFQGERIGRVDLAATGPGSPVPPGIPALPEPGEFYASPSLAKLLGDTPAAQLGDRFPGALVGTIDSEALPAPDTLIIIIGRDAADLSQQDGAGQVTQISTTPPSECVGECAPGVGTGASGMTLVLSVVAAALLFPVLVFIGGATRLSAARREQRFAAMRLVGATPRQISELATTESSVATMAGVAVGFGLFYALRPVIATIPFSGDRFFTGDLSLSLANVLLVAIGIPAAAAVAARIALRRVSISPLGVTRRVAPRPPRAWRLIPLAAGVAELGYLAYFQRHRREQEHHRPGLRVPARRVLDHDRVGDRRTVADHARLPAHGPPRQAARWPHRRPPPQRQPQVSVPCHQRGRARGVRRYRRHRHHHHHHGLRRRGRR